MILHIHALLPKIHMLTSQVRMTYFYHWNMYQEGSEDDPSFKKSEPSFKYLLERVGKKWARGRIHFWIGRQPARVESNEWECYGLPTRLPRWAAQVTTSKQLWVVRSKLDGKGSQDRTGPADSPGGGEGGDRRVSESREWSPSVWGEASNVSRRDRLRCSSARFCSFVHSLFDRLSDHTLEPDSLSSCSSPATFQPCDLRKVTVPPVPLFLHPRNGRSNHTYARGLLWRSHGVTRPVSVFSSTRWRVGAQETLTFVTSGGGSIFIICHMLL